jgi:hypothetical protein
LHLAAKHFIESITPLSQNDPDTPGAHTGDPASDNDSNNDEETLDSGDLLGKAIALVKQVKMLSLHKHIFHTHTSITDL